MRRARLRSGQWLAVGAGVLTVAVAVAVLLSLLAIERLSDRRTYLLERLDPASDAALRLSTALVNEETGVRGYVLGGDSSFLAPYRSGRAQSRRELTRLAHLLPRAGLAMLAGDLGRTRKALVAWEDGYAEPVVARAGSPVGTLSGQARFAAVRRALRGLQRDLEGERDRARSELDEAAASLERSLIAALVLLALCVAAVVLTVRATITRPVGALARDVRAVTEGDFDHSVRGSGARELVELGRDVDAMRERITQELEAVGRARLELERSNRELEQFAYVASHDLQEPLRKVGSFTQMLERRYKGRLDERADEYIALAVDGAKRMQVLINDLLAFSRVGRIGKPPETVPAGELIADALAALDAAIAEADARIEAPRELPPLHGVRSLLVGVFQNLIGNAIKFRAPEHPPHVRIACEPVSEDGRRLWRFTVADDGIGVEPEYAERIFVIFQRLHVRDAYAGTGIGLAMCRKIVEYHGGRIWLDTNAPGPGATFRFTLPAVRKDPVT